MPILLPSQLRRFAFTLVELIVVLIIISLLIGFTTLRITQAIDSAQTQDARASLYAGYKIGGTIYTDEDENYGTAGAVAARMSGDGVAAVAIAGEGATPAPAGSVGVYVYDSGASIFLKKILDNGDVLWLRDENGVVTRSWDPGATPLTPSGYSMVTVGADHGCGNKENVLYCWGLQQQGQLGNGSTAMAVSNVLVPVTMSGALAGTTVEAMDSGYKYTCVIASGAAYCWGYGIIGQLGQGGGGTSSTPVAVATGTGLAGKTVTDIATGFQHTCAIANGLGYCWGDRAQGALGNNGSILGLQTSPSAVFTAGALGGRALIDISAGYQHTCAIDTGGAAYCWGRDNNGQMGNDVAVTPNSNVPVAVSTAGVLAGKTLVQIEAGERVTCALDNAGDVYCWGNGSTGELGAGGGTLSSGVPVAVTMGGAMAGKDIVKIDTGMNTSADHVCAHASTGEVYCWGSNAAGRLGDNVVSASSNVPVAIHTGGLLSGKTITEMAVGAATTCVVADAALYCWGSGISNATGDGTETVTNRQAVAVLPEP